MATRLLVTSAAFAVVCIIWAAIRSLPGRYRGFATAAALVLVAAAGSGVVAALWARADLQIGLVRARAALAEARAGDLSAAQRDLGSSRAHLEAGRRKLGAWWGRPAQLIPVEAQNLSTAMKLATVAVMLTDAGRGLFTAGRINDIHTVGGRVPLGAMTSAGEALGHAEAVLSASSRALASIDMRWLVSPVADRARELQQRVAAAANSVTSAHDADVLAAQMLDGSRRYFLAITTPSELRGATGLIANYGVLATDHGAASLTSFGRMEDLAARAPRQPTGLGWDADFVADYGADLEGALWQNLTMTPDFPVAAQAIEALYPRSGGEPVDGVIAIDPAGLAAVLAVEGPIRVASWPVPLGAANVVAVLEHDQYNAFPDLAHRVAFLSDLSHAVVAQLHVVDGVGLAGIMRAFGGAVRGKHLIIASSHPDEEAALVRLGVGGAMPPLTDDYLGVLTTNAGTNKVDWYLHRTVGYRVTLAGAAIDARTTVTLHNDAPPSGEAPSILEGTPSDLVPGANREILSIVSPWDIVGLTVGGAPARFSFATSHGLRTYSVTVQIPPGGSVTVQLDTRGTRRLIPYHLDVLAQPTAQPDQLNVGVDAGQVPIMRRSVSVMSDLSLAELAHT